MARGQTETLGMVLLLAITIVGVSVVVVAASGALGDAQETSAVERAEHSMSLLDARGSLVALGRTDGQSVSLADSSEGEYSVRPDSGRMVVSQLEDGNRTEYVNTTLGAVVYENGDTEVAYQGGGVWRSSGAGAEMVSPPEFNYRGATLTLPVIRVTGDVSEASGSPTARLSPDEVGTPVFPNENNSNPLTGGNVTVTVYSEYYRGWAAYFEERTTGNVTVYPNESRVDLRLIARDSSGIFSLQDPTYRLRGLAEDNPIETLSYTLESKTRSGFPNGWALVADDGGSEELRISGEKDPCEDQDITVVYDSGTTEHMWENGSAFSDEESTFTVDCEGDKPTAYLNLTGDTNLSYPDGESPLSNDSTGFIVNHYLSEIGPDVTLEVEKGTGSGKSAGIQLDESQGEVEYNASSSRVVTFLHVTENIMNVTVS